MAANKKINPFSKQNEDTGFGNKNFEPGNRFINKDGTYNLVKEGMPFFTRFSLFHDMLNLPRWKFIMVILLFYVAINIAFTIAYFLAGPSQLAGLAGGNQWDLFKDIFFLVPKPLQPWVTVTCTRREMPLTQLPVLKRLQASHLLLLPRV